MIETISPPTNYRFERKFTVKAIHHAEVLHFIKQHPALFREIYHPRKINNIYLDTTKLKFYRDNKVGISNRKKVRIRWYGYTFGTIKNPKLEYKLKSGLLGDKWIFELNDFLFQPGFFTHNLIALFNSSGLPSPINKDLQNLNPTLLNTYHRTYFLSANKKFRLTLDEKMTYYRVDHPVSHFKAVQKDLNDFIIELKYKPQEDNEANGVSAKLPFRMDKSSKYMNGINATNFQI